MDVTLIVLQYGLKYGPEVAALVQKMLAKTEPPTQAEYDALFGMMAKSGQSYFEK